MVVSLLGETSKLCLQNLLKPNKIWVRSAFLAARQPQRRYLFQLPSQLSEKRKNLFCRFSSSFSSSANGFRKWYLLKLETNPIITKSVSASLVYAAADITSQMITMPSEGSFDFFRLQRMCSYAFLITGPCHHVWFGFLAKIMPKTNLWTILAKMVMGQVIYGPCVGTIFFSYNAALRGENGQEIVARLKRDIIPMLKTSIVFWPFCDLLTFMLVPVKLQPLVTSSFAYVWIVYLSYMGSLKKVETVEINELALVEKENNCRERIEDGDLGLQRIYCSKQSGQNPIVSGLWQIWVGAPFLAPRQTQRRAFTKLASHLRNNQPSLVNPNSARHLSSSCSSSSTPPPPKTGFLNWYLRKLETHPIITKSVSSSLIYTSADITSQIITMPADGSFDLFRMLRISAYGFLIMGPSQHYWFTSLSKIMPQKNVTTTLSKIFMGQFIYGPCMNTIFYSYNAAIRGETRDEIVARLKRDLLPTLKNGLMYWPLCDFITFMFIPVHLQPLMNSSS